ncbi:arginase family protein [Candidatus Woesearchaeota archaeon]|nr:arginase family protein [Candidatus Woesearchaeota archaeon]
MIVLKAPFSKGSLGRNPGACKAPDAIIRQLDDLYVSESGISPSFKYADIAIDQSDIVATNKAILESVKSQDFRERVCMLGGDHSTTFPAFRAFKQKFPDSGILILDAHPDCEAETDPPSHEDFVRKLIADGIVEKNRIIIFGLRNWTGNEKHFLDSNNIKYFSMKQISMNAFSDVVDGLTETVRNWPNLYLSIDIDIADPSCAPGTGYIEPGGLTSRELIYLIQRLKLLKNLRMTDIVEVGPDKDMNGMTSKLAAKLLVELS